MEQEGVGGVQAGATLKGCQGCSKTGGAFAGGQAVEFAAAETGNSMGDFLQFLPIC